MLLRVSRLISVDVVPRDRLTILRGPDEAVHIAPSHGSCVYCMHDAIFVPYLVHYWCSHMNIRLRTSSLTVPLSSQAMVLHARKWTLCGGKMTCWSLENGHFNMAICSTGLRNDLQHAKRGSSFVAGLTRSGCQPCPDVKGNAREQRQEANCSVGRLLRWWKRCFN
jgi:hypothetical protein